MSQQDASSPSSSSAQPQPPLLLTLEPYQEQKILYYNDNGEEVTVHEQSDEQRFAFVVNSMLDFRRAVARQHAASRIFASGDSTQRLETPDLIDPPKPYYWTKTINRMRDGIHELKTLERFVQELQEHRYLGTEELPSQQITAQESSKEFREQEQKQLFADKQRQLQNAASLLEKGRARLARRVIQERSHFDALYKLQQQTTSCWKLVEPQQQAFGTEAVIDLAFQNVYLSQRYRYVPASVIRRSMPKKSTNDTPLNAGETEMVMLDVLLPAIATYGAVPLSVNDYLYAKQGIDVRDLDAPSHQKHIDEMLIRSQKAVFDREVFDACYNSLLYVGQCAEEIQAQATSVLHESAGLSGDASTSSISQSRKGNRILAETAGSFFKIVQFSKYSVQVAVTAEHSITVSLVPDHDNTFLCLSVDQNCIGDSEMDRLHVSEYVELLLRESLLDVREFIRRNASSRWPSRVIGSDVSTSLTQNLDVFLSGASSQGLFTPTLSGLADSQQLKLTGVAPAVSKPQVPALGYGTDVDARVNDFACKRFLDVILHIRHKMFFGKQFIPMIEQVSRTALEPMRGLRAEVQVLEQHYPDRTVLNLSLVPSDLQSTGSIFSIDISGTKITAQLPTDFLVGNTGKVRAMVLGLDEFYSWIEVWAQS